MSSLRVEPVQLGAVAGRFGELMADFEALVVTGLDLGEFGDSALTTAIERFIEWSQENIGACSNQFGQVQQLLTAAAHGYESVERHVVDEITEGQVNGVIEDK